MPSDLHVSPIDDLKEHDLHSRSCWCSPRLEQDDPDEAVLVIHFSADGRELVEEHGLN